MIITYHRRRWRRQQQVRLRPPRRARLALHRCMQIRFRGIRNFYNRSRRAVSRQSRVDPRYNRKPRMWGRGEVPRFVSERLVVRSFLPHPRGFFGSDSAFFRGSLLTTRRRRLSDKRAAAATRRCCRFSFRLARERNLHSALSILQFQFALRARAREALYRDVMGSRRWPPETGVITRTLSPPLLLSSS